MNMSAIEFRQVYKSFNHIPILAGMDFAIRPGETVTIIGGSGIGKSVTLKLIVGLLKPEAGHILIEGEDIVPLPEDRLIRIRKKIGMVFQSSALFDSLSVAENIAYPLREHTAMSEWEIHERITETLYLVGLEGADDKAPADLSGGMRKRVALARAIALTPKIILYDEPTTGLDPINTEKINELIVDMNRKLEVTSVVVTHDMRSAFKISDRIGLLDKGKIVVVGTPEEIQRADLPLVRQFVNGTMG
ncbi:organic solvent ABC transporter ATP-binding protein [Candidatus Methylomirabilis lanthanidiphila]|uniref:Organic solvent ABC transporter ATP-binding protein n=1 Tax=Candidatus Methylomirabilis lanthanidiphila TaxID=2211376 RepID=A0A564ZG17_9BACT|nr:ABC transporter ATP-binding protein [Candidatus Methylomirabilis lanthanidiphila]VUZ84076.1 organic solvent ABC transporter ATP-binding protein [Candidatus Methylomirabilis lanthanidiphila]